MNSHYLPKLSLLLACAGLLLPGCLSQSESEVVVYSALDREFSEVMLDQFENETGISVLVKYDQESNKTVGLANQIIQQKSSQRCDLFWNNEILHTLRLQQAGLLRAWEYPLADSYPAQFRSPDQIWYGFAARARVLLVNTDRLPDRDRWPNSVRDLIDPKWEGDCAIAKPFFGTTATHAAVLYDLWGVEAANEFFVDVATNAVVEGGNKQVAINVSRGRHAFGLTDTDDAIIELEQGNPVAIVFPDQDADSEGTLLIPNTLCLPANSPNPHEAEQLAEFLLQQSVEEQLAKGRSAQIPLNANSHTVSRVEPEKLKVMTVDFNSAARNWDRAANELSKIFQ